MRTLPVLAAAVLLSLLLTSCETKSDHPLSPAKSAQIDQRLIGDWSDRTDSEPETCRFSKTNDHWMRFEIIPSKLGKKTESYDCFQTVIEGETYLNVRMRDENSHAQWYQFTRYTITDGNVLKIWSMSNDAAAAAIRAGKLKGTVDELYDRSQVRPLHPEVNVTLHDTGENISRYIGSTNIYALFSEKMHPLTRCSR